jgi:hypothetical protein
MFKDAKAGDRVWSVRRGWGSVKAIHEGGYSIIVKFENCPELGSYGYDGMEFHHDVFPTLFWDEVKIVPPPKPKRKVKKVIEGYMQFTENRANGGAAFWVSNLFETEDGAVQHADGVRPLAGKPVYIRHGYEVEE